MKEVVDIAILPAELNNEDIILNKALRKCKCRVNHTDWQITKRSIDARQRQPLYRLRIEVYFEEQVPSRATFQSQVSNVSQKPSVIIIGAGPAGYFAALECLSQGLKPIIIERGKDVRARRKDLRQIQQFGNVNPDSNYCFGEGGAGTYSDGKLYTRSHKRGNIQSILEILVDHGSNPDILIDAHPHIGSNKLPGIISNIRETIESAGGEVLFDTKIVDFEVDNTTIKSAIDQHGNTHKGQGYILATGHSARDMFRLLFDKNIRLEPKPFAIGVRVEHPQPLIDEIQYNQRNREENLPASSYKVVSQVNEVGVFSFCMCPGGLIVPAATAKGEIVVNGMSLSKRDSPYANSGFVTAVSNEEIQTQGYTGVLANMDYQQHIESTLFSAGDGSQKAPALRMTDFVNKQMSKSLPSTSYIPGLFSAPLYDLLPKHIYNRLAQGMVAIGRKMKGFYTSEANVVGTESRTSSPIRIPRDQKTLVHPDITNLYPCGEGAGYAGGILSAAMDGQRVIRALKSHIS